MHKLSTYKKSNKSNKKVFYNINIGNKKLKYNFLNKFFSYIIFL